MATFTQAGIDHLTHDLIAANGGMATCNTKVAAKLIGCSVGKFRTLYYRGQVVGSRQAVNGPLTFRIRELARLLLEGEKHSLPVPKRSGVDHG